MNIVSILAGFMGFFVCNLVLVRMARWLYSIWLVNRERRANPARRSSLRVVATLLLSSAPWMFVLFIGFTVYILSVPHDAAWNGFFAGALISPFFAAFMVISTVRRRKAKLAKQ